MEAGMRCIWKNGTTAFGDALIGADGVHPRIREELFGDAPTTFTGFMAWRGVVPMDDRLPAHLRQQHNVRWICHYDDIIAYPLRRVEVALGEQGIGSLSRSNSDVSSSKSVSVPSGRSTPTAASVTNCIPHLRKERPGAIQGGGFGTMPFCTP
jgi:hypothetical protein